MTAQRLAQPLGVRGYVRNLPDGGVELVAEGDPTEVESLLEAVRRHFGGFIRDVQVIVETPDEPPAGEFTIRY